MCSTHNRDQTFSELYNNLVQCGPMQVKQTLLNELHLSYQITLVLIKSIQNITLEQLSLTFNKIETNIFGV